MPKFQNSTSVPRRPSFDTVIHNIFVLVALPTSYLCITIYDKNLVCFLEKSEGNMVR